MTYRELIEELKSIDEEQLDQTATIFVTSFDEYFPIKVLAVATEDDFLDEGQITLETQEEQCIA